MELPSSSGSLFELEKISGGVKNIPVKCKKLSKPKVADDLFPLHSLFAFVGARGSGKTNAAILLAKRYYQDKSINHIFVISPTYASNPEMHTLPLKEGDVYLDATHGQAALLDVFTKIGEMAKEWKTDKEYKKVYQRWQRRQHLFSDQLILESQNYRKPRDTPKPSPLLIIDDMMKTDLYSPSDKNPFTNFIIKHRHLHAVGVSVFMLVQNFKSGLPLFVRQNVQQFFIWETHDMKALEAMYEEFGNVCSFDTFLSVYSQATAKQHHFLTVDPFNPEKSHRFRQDFDTFLKPTESFSLTSKRKRKHEFNSSHDVCGRSDSDVEEEK
jgi:hypothetical protein